MSDSPESTDNAVNELLQTKEFGSVLKKARKKLNLSSDDVAESLLISVDIIKAIDSSQAQNLPAATFTQGYIRNYARLVEVSSDEVVADYLQMVPGTEQAFSPHSVIPTQKTSNDALLKMISISFVVALILVLIYWLFSTDFSIQKINSNNQIDVELKEDSTGETEYSLKPFGAKYKNESDADITDEDKISATTDTTSDLKNDDQSTNIKVKEVKAKEVKTDVAEKALDYLVLSALGESWCEAQDATGKRLFYQLLNRGDEVKLTGVAPFIVFLGNAPIVRVEINNQIVEFDHLINKQSNIANLEINTDASVTRMSNN